MSESTDHVEKRIANRRSLRLVGRTIDADDFEAGEILEGPDLIGPVTDIPKRSARAAPIRKRLLDAGELLFSKWGYTGVSVRDLTELAGTRLADVTYYFGSKQNLYLEVLKRRAGPLGDARVAALRQCDAQELGDGDYIKAWVGAYLLPPIALLEGGDDGWSCYLKLIANVAYSRLWPAAFGEYYNSTAEAFMSSLAKRFPEASSAIIQQCFLMLTASTMYTLARTGRVETFANPAFGSNDLDVAGPTTHEFVTAGLLGLLVAP